VVADPASDALHVVRPTGQSVIDPSGLPGPIDALTFADAEHGFAEVTESVGCATKTSCGTVDGYFTTSDGGRTWQLSTR
jgi:hypothetical protein